MRKYISYLTVLFALMLTGLLASACAAYPVPTETAATPAPSKPDWFGIPLEDAQSGETFTINDFAGKVVLIQTFAEWCPTCAYQANEVRDMVNALGNPTGLVLVSLDTDLHEDKASLKKYADYFDFGWRFAVSPLEVSHALGNLYSAEYVNPPLEPMLIIDRDGVVYGLPYGFKYSEQLKNTLEQYLQ